MERRTSLRSGLWPRCRLLILFCLLGLPSTVYADDQDDVVPASVAAIEAVLQADTDGAAQISYHPATGVGRFVRLPSGSLRQRLAGAEATGQAWSFLAAYGGLFGIEDANTQLQWHSTQRDKLGATHVIYRQYYQDTPVFAGELRIHFDAAGQLVAANGFFLPDLDLSVTPTLSATAAATVAQRHVTEQPLNEHGLGATQAETTFDVGQLYLFRENLTQGIAGANHLVYEVTVVRPQGERMLLYVDAHSGAVVEEVSLAAAALSRRVYLNTVSLDPNRLVWQEGDAFPYLNADLSTQSNINRIIDTTEDVYNFFASLSGGAYLSWDGADAPMNNLYASPSTRCPNAFWSGQTVSYCQDVVSDDLAAHEWAHGYTQATHGLVYQWQPGALNEAYSDIWGETIDLINGAGNDLPDAPRTAGSCTRFTHENGVDDSRRWLAFEDARGFGLALRDLWNPSCFGNPGKVSDTTFLCSSADDGGVHTNSGIPNHAYALVVDGGVYNGQTVRGLGLTKAANLYWRAQTIYQLRITDFADHADALEQSCTDLIGAPLFALDTADAAATEAPETISADDCTQVSAALAAVEMRAAPTQCHFATLLNPNAPALCTNEGPLTPLLRQDWEAGLSPWSVGARDVFSPATFSTANWAVVTSLPLTHTGSAAFVADADIGDGMKDNEAGVLYLESPPFTLPAEALAPRLAFDHWFASEQNNDGGNLKISVNGGAWQLIPKAAFTFNPYNLAITTGGASEAAFSGTNYATFDEGSWGQSQLRLGDLAKAGDEIRLRFEFHLNPSGGVHGWYVDDVQAYYCQSCGNGRINEGESCDDGNQVGGDGCANLCQLEDGWFCKAPVLPLPNRPAEPSACVNLASAVCSTPNAPIPDDDPTGLTDVITLSMTGASGKGSALVIRDLEVYVEARHSWLGDLSLVLTKLESGHQVTLIDRPGSVAPGAFGCSGKDMAAYFDDESVMPAESSCTTGQPALAGNFVTGNGLGIGLSSFDNELANGRWTLTVRDHATDELGLLERWCLVPAVQNSGASDHLFFLPLVGQ